MKETDVQNKFGNVADIIAKGKTLNDAERAGMLDAVSALQDAVMAMAPAVESGNGAVMLVCGIGQVRAAVGCGSLDVIHDALVDIGNGIGHDSEAFGAMLLHAALEVAPQLLVDVRKVLDK